MQIAPSSGISTLGLAATQNSAPTSASSFGNEVSQFFGQVNQLQHRADSMAGQLAFGDVRSMHAVMIASEEASVGLSAALQLRNKATDAYQEIMRMQV